MLRRDGRVINRPYLAAATVLNLHRIPFSLVMVQHMRVFRFFGEAPMPKLVKGLAALAAGLLLMIAAPQGRAQNGISVITQNQYLGGHLGPLLRAPDAESFNDALVGALRQIAASDFVRRADRLAEPIARRRPHLVALQEVWSFRCIDAAEPIPGRGCDDLSVAGAFQDQLKLTLSALAARGAAYHAVATVENLDLRDFGQAGQPAGLPFGIDGTAARLIALDRAVILARDDIVAAGKVRPARLSCEQPSADGCNFRTFVMASTPSGPLPLKRGFVAVDAVVGGREYRFVNTHLETPDPDPANPLSRFFQAAQASELIEALAMSTPPGKRLILAGDFNSSPDDTLLPGPLPLPAPFDAGIVPPCMQLAQAGYHDIWTARPESGSGFTCCQLGDLSNEQSRLYKRIDMLFTRGAPASVISIELVGNRPADRTPPPGPSLWSSDHAGLIAEILF